MSSDPIAVSPGADALRSALPEHTGTRASEWFLTFKARQAMRVVFDAIAARGGAEVDPAAPGEVVTQLYTCCTAVDPIVAAGLIPVYGDIDPDTSSLDAHRLPLSARVRAVVLQHTYGIVDPAADGSLLRAARQAGALLVEDCAHCVGRLSRGGDGHPISDVSVHSFGVEKMLPTHFGGAVWVSPDIPDPALRADIVRRLRDLPVIDRRRARAARHYRTQTRILNHLPRNLSHVLRNGLVSHRLYEPAIAGVELAGGLASDPQAPDEWVASAAARSMRSLDANEAQRAAAVAAYSEAFARRDGLAGARKVRTPCVGATDPAGAQPLLRYPVFLDGPERADAAVAAVRKAGHYAVGWYRRVLFPGVPNPADYRWDGGLGPFPSTRANADGAACLPTDVSPEEARAIARIALGV